MNEKCTICGNPLPEFGRAHGVKYCQACDNPPAPVLFTFVYHSQDVQGVYQVIATSEQDARDLMVKDGRTGAAFQNIYSLETFYKLADDNHTPCIPWTIEFERSTP